MKRTNYIAEARALIRRSKVTAYIRTGIGTVIIQHILIFENMGGDCGKFIGVGKQIRAGGKSMKEQPSKFSNLVCRTNSTNQLSKVSSTWRGQDALGIIGC